MKIVTTKFKYFQKKKVKPVTKKDLRHLIGRQRDPQPPDKNHNPKKSIAKGDWVFFEFTATTSLLSSIAHQKDDKKVYLF